MPRVGLTPVAVAAAAAELMDAEGRDALSLARLASELGVRPPSLYNHVDGLDGLERLVALQAVRKLADTCREAVMGRGGVEGLRALADAYRRFAVAHPGTYPLTQVARPGDGEYEEEAGRLLEPVLALLSGLGLADAELVHAARAVRSALHGFASLETGDGFGLEVDVDASFEWLCGMLERGVTPAVG